MKYKIYSSDGQDAGINQLSDSGQLIKSIPISSENWDYREFIEDIYKNGLGIVEGADYVGVTTYTEARKEEYPPLEEQLDKILPFSQTATAVSSHDVSIPKVIILIL